MPDGADRGGAITPKTENKAPGPAHGKKWNMKVKYIHQNPKAGEARRQAKVSWFQSVDPIKRPQGATD